MSKDERVVELFSPRSKSEIASRIGSRKPIQDVFESGFSEKIYLGDDSSNVLVLIEISEFLGTLDVYVSPIIIANQVDAFRVLTSAKLMEIAENADKIDLEASPEYYISLVRAITERISENY